jgi:hypothetical protein
MTDAEYLQTQRQLVLLAQIVDSLDLDGFLRRIEVAESVGPILNPTLYTEGAENLLKVKGLARACKVFQDEVRKQMNCQEKNYGQKTAVHGCTSHDST